MKIGNYMACLCVAMAMSEVASASDYYYFGPSNAWDKAEYYSASSSGSPRSGVLPGANDAIILRTGQEVYIDDAVMPFFSGIGRISLKYNRVTIFMTVTNDCAAFDCFVGDAGQRGYQNNFIVKLGSGTLKFTKQMPVPSSGIDCTDYNVGCDIREGDVVLEPTTGRNYRHKHGEMIVGRGCTLHCVVGGINGFEALSGEGVVTNDGDEAGYTVLTLGRKSDPPSVFAGKLSGKWRYVNLVSSQYFTGTANDFTCSAGLRVYGDDGTDPRAVVGFQTLAGPSGTPSSLGMSRYIGNQSSAMNLRYLGTDGETTAAAVLIDNTGLSPTTIDGGAHGGLVWNGDFEQASENLKQQRICLTGSNTVACVVSNSWTANSPGCSYAVTKDGTGTWRFAQNDSRAFTGVLAVRDGTVEFDSIDEAGWPSALGLATELYEDKCDVVENLLSVNYAYLLGDVADAAKCGTLSYVGDEFKMLRSRSIALAGNGAFKAKPGSIFKYTAGVTSAGSGEKDFVIDAAAGATNVISGITDEGEGIVSVIKRGTGFCQLAGNLSFHGDLRVEAGDMVVQNNLNGAPYRWYKLTIKETAGSSPLPEYATWTARNTNNGAGRASRSVALDEFGLYDGQGNRLNLFDSAYSSFHDAMNAYWFSLGERQISMERIDEIALRDTSSASKWSDCSHLINNSHSGGAGFYVMWNSLEKWPRINEKDTWMNVVLRLANDAAAAEYYDLCYLYPTNASSGYFAASPTAFAISASADGLNWEEIASTNNVVFLPSDYYTWLSDGASAKAAATKPEAVAHAKIALPRTSMAGTFSVLNHVRSVAVSRGASLMVEGDPVTVPGVKLGTDGLGTVSGINLAKDNGTIDLTCDLSGRPKSLFFPADFTQFGEAQNVLGYTVTVNGQENARYSATVRLDGVTLTAKGLVLVVR